jgi:hypothetical protein
MNDPAYPPKLFQRVITVSLETLKIVRGLPKRALLASCFFGSMAPPKSIVKSLSRDMQAPLSADDPDR